MASDDYRGVVVRALLSLLTNHEASRAGLCVTSDQVASAAERFRKARGLASADRTRAWLAESALTQQDFTELCRLDVVIDELGARYGRLLDDAIATELKRSGAFAEYATIVGATQRALAARGTPRPSLEDSGLDAKGLLAWYAKRFRPIHGGLDAHAKERGFPDTAAFLREVVRAYCAEKPDGM